MMMTGKQHEGSVRSDSTMSTAITLTQAIAYFEEAEELSLSSRTLAEKCRDYYDHKQWTAQEAATLRKRKQPVITRNRIKPKIDYLRGIELQTRTDPEASARTPGDEDAAQTATDAVRYVYDSTRFAKIKSDVFENLAIEGTGGVEVYCKPGKKGAIDIHIRRYHWDRLGWDPHSRERDFSDTLYRYAVVWMDYDRASERYPEKDDVLSGTFSQEGTLSSTYDDAPRQRWADARRKRVRIVKLEFIQGGEVWVCEFTRGGFLAEPEPSPYLDDMGAPEWSIIMQSSHVDRDGNRYGYVKAWIDIQDEINKRASKHLHLVSVRQTFSTEGGGEDVQKLKMELAKPDGHLKFTRGEFGKDFGVLPNLDQASAQFQLLQEAKQEIDSIGVNGAMAGNESRDLSGVALRKLQQGASTELKPLFESIAQFDNQVCRAVWNRVKQFWTAEKWIRVTDDDEAPRWIGLNIPVTVGDQIKEETGEIPAEIQDDPRLSTVVGIRNNIAEIDVDFTITEVPDVVNAMQEQFEALVKIFPAVPDDKKSAAFEMLLEASTLRNKKKFMDKFKSGADAADPQAQQVASMQERMTQLQEELIQAKIDLTKAQAGKVGQDAELANANKVVKMVEALYSGMQTAQVAVTVPGVAPVADAIVKSAGFVDQDQSPVYPAVQEQQQVMPVDTTMPQNTDPRFPANPVGPGVGMMHGLETQRNDGSIL
jgi:hypothetical protein